jgi:transcriptional regulator with XRE-family HTH domain
MSVDRRGLNVMLAALDLEQKQLAERMGYESRYVSNVFNGFTPPSEAFKAAFGTVLADVLLGDARTSRPRGLPARPFFDYLERRAETAVSRRQFYSDLGLRRRGWSNRNVVSEELVDRVCCELGIHMSHIYGGDLEIEEAS